MKVLLVTLPRNFAREAPGLISIPPLGMAHVASYVRQHGYDVELDDLDIKIISNKKLFDQLIELHGKYTPNELEEYLLNDIGNEYLDKVTDLLITQLDYGQCKVIGFSLIESSAKNSMLLIAKKLKQLTGATIVIGGGSASPELQEKYNFIDYVVLGLGEIPFLNILEKISGRKTEGKKEILPIFPHPLPDFTGLPLDCYKLMPEGSQFRNPGKLLILPYLWSEGCPYRCSYCGSSTREGYFKPPHRTAQETADQLEELSKKYHTKYFFNLNSYVHIDKEHTIELCNELIKRNLELLWCGSARCDMDNTLLPLLFKAGLFYISFGLESGSDKILKSMNKGYKAETAERTIHAAHNAGMWIAVFIISGFPHETEEDFKKTFDFVERNHEYIDQMSVCPFYLVNSAVLLHPDKFGIAIRDKIGQHRHSTNPEFAYDEIGGLKWEDLKVVKQKRLNMIYRLFYGLHKKIPESIYRADTYQVFYAFDKYQDKGKVYQYLLDQYKEERSKTERIISINGECNNNCIYCKRNKEAVQPLNGLKETIKRYKVGGVKKIIISGGEPTMCKDLLKVIRLINDEGLDITLRTNARTLSYLIFCKKLFDMGVRKISVPIYSNNPDVHDEVTKVRGSFDQTMTGINNWKSLGGRVEIRTVLYDGNRKDLYNFVEFILDTETDHFM